MRFEAGAEDEFEAACGLLVGRLVRWAGEQGLPVDGFMAEAALDYRHRATVDGRLGLWEPRHVEELLLSWLPEQVTELPGEECGDAPGTLCTLLRFLHAAQLADPRGMALEDSLAAVDAAAEGYPAAMADRTRWGLAKFWAMTAAEQGVDVLDGAAMQLFAERVQRGEVAYDERALGEILERRLTGRVLSGVARAEPQLPVVLPLDDELRRQAGASTVVAQLRGIAEWAGRDGRAVTTAGRLRIADARELVEALGTGDKAEGVRSSADLPRLGLLVEWAKKARLVRVVKGRLYAVAKARPVLADPFQLWLRVFDACFELRQALIGARSGWHVGSMLFDVYEEVLEDVLNTLYSLPHSMPWPHLRDSVHLAYRARFPFDGGADLQHRMWFEHADRDLRTVLDALVDLGAIERDSGMADPVFLDVDLCRAGDELPADMPPEVAELLGTVGAPKDAAAQERARARCEELTAGPVELLRLTELGTRAVRQRLLAAGRDAPLVGELAQAPAAGLLGVLAEEYDPEAARAELAGWISAHGERDAALRQLTEAVGTMALRTRAQAMLDVLLTALSDGEGERLLRALRGDARLAPLALSVLAHRELLSPEDMTDAEHLLVLAESLLQLVELAGGEDGAVDALRAQGPEARHAVAAVLDSAHPDRAGLEELRQLAARAWRTPAARLGRGRKHGRRVGKSGRKRHR
ncbi:hypothetical protein AQI88_36505 [Streptomyces cellostaticus]|uniref:Uncharacterized protein n=1 Tax=Streptomyces cellostaticus TaxID=67285 RepID=A0A117PTQ7_9ACTN|nr:hypothetical protein [Streptomyces cellostaticus]KUM91477.1 hypothetical protein AQI88_36505 [Streptomyces cellostaticus]GHI04820.1 hypothetical protein Scel_31410 [Streptomyces cellostaticus]